MNTAKLLEIYEYANRIGNRFRSPRYSKQDMVQDLILFVLENPQYLEEIIYIRSFVYRNLRWNRCNFVKKAENKKVFNYIDKPIESLEKEVSFLDGLVTQQISDIEAHSELSIIDQYLTSKDFNKSSNSNTGRTKEVFDLMLKGFTPDQIGSQVKMTRGSVNCSVKTTRKKLNKHFRK
jgi:DNA-directed RNA polymerase specialized sigma24 family protein